MEAEGVEYSEQDQPDPTLVFSGPEHGQYFQKISEATENDKHLYYRSPSTVERDLKEGRFLLAFKGERLAGWIELSPIWGKWWGLFSFYVEPDYQRRGIGTKLLKQATLEHKDEIIYAATYSPGVDKKFESLGYKRTSLSDLPGPLLVNLVRKRLLNRGIVHNLSRLGEPIKYFVYGQNQTPRS